MTKLARLAAKFPVTVRLDAVVEARVDDPEIARFTPAIFPVEVRLETVVEARVEEAETERFCELVVEELVVLA